MRPVLVVDDDAKILRLVRTYLEREGMPVIEAGDGRSALAQIALDEPALIVLDVMLPEVDGLSVLEALRRTSRTPVLMVSARGSVADRIEGLEVGADDYLAKPFSPAELVIRVKRLLERAGELPAGPTSSPAHHLGQPLRHSDLVLDRARHEAFVSGVPVELTRAEFRLLETLLEANGHVLTRDQLIDAVHGSDGLVLDRTIDVHVGRVRKKLGDSPASPRYVATVRGIGYRVPIASPTARQSMP
jgi:DNA-binding response OmpR family regulator